MTVFGLIGLHIGCIVCMEIKYEQQLINSILFYSIIPIAILTNS